MVRFLFVIPAKAGSALALLRAFWSLMKCGSGLRRKDDVRSMTVWWHGNGSWNDHRGGIRSQGRGERGQPGTRCCRGFDTTPPSVW